MSKWGWSRFDPKRQIVKRELIKKWSFFEGVQNRDFTDPRLEIKMLILDKFYKQKMKLC